MTRWVPRGLQLFGTWLTQHAPLVVLLALGGGLLLFWLLPEAGDRPRRPVPTSSSPAASPSAIAALPLQQDTKHAETLQAQRENETLRGDLKQTNTALREVHQSVAHLQQDLKARESAYKMELEDLKKQVSTSQQARTSSSLAARPAATGPTPEERRLQAELEKRRAQERATPSPPQPDTDFNRLVTFRVNKEPSPYPTPPSPVRADLAYLDAGCQAPVTVVTGASVSGRTDRARPMLLSLTAPFHCPYQLQGPGRASLATEIPLQGCFALVAAGADMMASRVLGEGTLLSCVMPDLAAFERPIKAYVVGSDGNLGLPGTLETHESAAVAKATFTALLQEASALIGLSRSKVLVTYQGGYGSGPQPGQGLQNGLLELQRYFLDQARALTPEIRASRGTRGYLVMQEGLALDGLPTQILLTSRGR